LTAGQTRAFISRDVLSSLIVNLPVCVGCSMIICVSWLTYYCNIHSVILSQLSVLWLLLYWSYFNLFLGV